jgi:hypothetical protein
MSWVTGSTPSVASMPVVVLDRAGPDFDHSLDHVDDVGLVLRGLQG